MKETNLVRLGNTVQDNSFTERVVLPAVREFACHYISNTLSLNTHKINITQPLHG